MTRPERTRPLVALDTETTGPNFQDGDRPFSVALAWPGDPDDFDSWETKWFHWPVDPFSRRVSPNKSDIKYLREIIFSHRVVFHNAKFDIRALASVGINMVAMPNAKGYEWKAYDDTLLASHVCDPSESHALKDLALKYLDIPDDDQKDLHDLVVRLRRKAKDLGWNTSPTVACDYWLPAAMAEHYKAKMKGDDGPNWSIDSLRTYNVLDAKRTMALWLMYEHVMEAEDLLPSYFRERLLQFVVYRMETVGVTLRRNTLLTEIKRYSQRRDECEGECQRIASHLGYENEDGELLNIRSNKQLPFFLFGPKKAGCLGLRSIKTTKEGSGDSTDKDAIKLLLQRERSAHGHPIAVKFLENLTESKVNKTAAGYLEGYREKLRADRDHPGRYYILPTLNQTGTNTTRFSHSNPNSANVGKGKETEDGEKIDFNLRVNFGPAIGRIWYAYDYQQLQLRIWATDAGEEQLLEGFRLGYDAHDMVASKIFDMTVEELRALPDDEYTLKRRIGKNTNFGFIFGAGPAKIEHTSGMKGLSKLLDKTFPHAKEFMERTIRQVEQYGWVKTRGGYRLMVPKDRAYAGVCYIVQGNEGEIVKNAMISVDNYLHTETHDDAYLTLQVHDELVIDFPSLSSQRLIGGSNPKSHRKLAKVPESNYENKERLGQLAHISALMVKAGADLGIETPVSCERIRCDWAHGEEMDLSTIHTESIPRPYRKTGKYKGHLAKYRGGRLSREEIVIRSRKQRAKVRREKQLARLSSITKRL